MKSKLARNTMLLMVVIIMLVLQSLAYGQRDCARSCSEPKRDTDHIVIDANTGKRISGKTKFPEDANVQIILANKNPFKYGYRLNIESTPLESAIVLDFLRLVPIANIGSILNRALGLEEPLQAGSAFCPGQQAVEDAFAAYEVKRDAAVNGDTALKSGLTNRNQTITKYNKFLTDTDRDTGFDTVSCQTICKTADELRGELDRVIKVDDLSKALADLQKKITATETAIQPLEAAVNNIPGNADNPERPGTRVKDVCLAALTAERTKIANLKANAAIYEAAINEIKGKKAAFEALQKIIANALDSENPFHEVHYTQSVGEATNSQITVLRRNLRVADSKEVAVTTFPIQLGESSISLSGGFGFSTIDEKKIIRQAGLVPNGMGGTMVGNRFGFENNSTFKPSGVIMLNGHLKSFNLFGMRDVPATFALSLGLVLSSRESGIEPEFIAGPSLGLLRNKMFLTFGYHAARVENLAGGFKIGDPVPAELQDPLPLEKNYKSGGMFAITFKFR